MTLLPNVAVVAVTVPFVGVETPELHVTGVAQFTPM
jgi:hypothetical protein